MVPKKVHCRIESSSMIQPKYPLIGWQSSDMRSRRYAVTLRPLIGQTPFIYESLRPPSGRPFFQVKSN
jgi:hypothetical protein